MRRKVLRVQCSFAAAVIGAAVLAAPAGARPASTSVEGDRARSGIFDAGPVAALAAEAGMSGFLDAVERWRNDQRNIERFEWFGRQFVSDWSGDGRSDDVSIHQVFTLDGVETRTVATLRAADGDTGDVMWMRRWKRDDDTFFFPVEARVGPKGVAGIVLVEVSGVAFETTGIDYRYTAFTHRGKRLWSRSFSSTIAGSWPITYTATDYLVTAELFDGLPGKATDMLLAGGTVVVPPAWSLQGGIIRAFVIDGRDGSLVDHPLPEIGVGFVPFAGAMDDFDHDGFDDYVLVNERPNVGPGEDGGTEPVAIGTGVVAARKGTDGMPLWTGGGLELSEHNVTLTNLGNVVGTPEGDVFVETMSQLLDAEEDDDTRTYLFEGEGGRLVWKRRGQWPYSPGDIDADGRRDVLTQHYYSDDGFVATTVRAFTYRGRRLWRREYRTEHPLQSCCSARFHWGGGWGVGDFDGDEASDGFISHRAGGFQVTEFVDAVENFVIDAASGRVLAKGGEEFQPLGAPAADGGLSDYARVTWSAGRTKVDVYDGTTSTLLTSSELGFDVPLPPEKSYVFVEAGRLDRDSCADVAVSVHAPGGLFEAMLDGSDGSLLWWRSIGLRDGSVRLAGSTDANDAC